MHAEIEQAVHAHAQRQRAVLYDGKCFVPQMEHKRILRRIRKLANVRCDERDGIFLLKQQSARLFTAKAHAHFHAAAELLIKAWVFTANLAQSIIAKL